MRVTESGDYLRVRAIAGTHVVVVAWDFADEPTVADFVGDQNLLGFAIHRTKYASNGDVESSYFLRGMKRFEGKDKGLPAGSLVQTNEHPVQSFQWADYTAQAEGDYEYAVYPVFGKPKKLSVAKHLGTSVRLRCEPTVAPEGGTSRHDVHFNRGVIGSQAYAREFDNEVPDANYPESAPMKWLSRGLYESLLGFIALGSKPGMGLRAAFYEFHYLPVARALAQAAVDGDVQIVYDAESSYKKENNETILMAELGENVNPRTVTEGIRHNKFIVLLEGGVPVSVWTGSTNISAGGIFGHSNVGHVVYDPVVAQKYLDYWDLLKANLTPTKLRKPNAEATPLPEIPFDDGVWAIFSPRDRKDASQEEKTLQWYANLANSAEQMVCFTAAFDIAEEFQLVFRKQNDVLRYIVKDDPLSTTENIGTDGDVVFAAGGHLDFGALANFLQESSNPLNRNDYIHTKYMLVDPLGESPIVVTGSANFSNASQVSNDENMLVIKGDTRVADIYFGEFMRLFDHHYARYLSAKYKSKGGGFLKESADKWLPAHLDHSSYKAKRRRYFAG